MSAQSVRCWLAAHAPELRLIEVEESTATVATAADGWGGDSYHQWFDGESAALVIVYSGDTPQDVEEMEEALLSFATEDFPEDHFAWVDQIDGDLYFIATDDTEVGERLRADLGLG